MVDLMFWVNIERELPSPLNSSNSILDSICIIDVISYIDLSGGSKPLLGDILVIAGTIFYAFSNVGEVGELSQINLLTKWQLKYAISSY